MKLIQRIHGILFVAGEAGVSEKQLIESLAVSSKDVKEAIQQLKLNLDHDDESPIELVNYSGLYQLVTKKELNEDVEAFAQAPFNQSLSRAALETLAIIAYRQPITRVAVDEIRGVSSQNMIQKLVTRDLIKEIGRIEAPGRPYLYGVTNYFMDYFGLKSLEDLPPIEPIALNAKLASEELFNTKEWKIELFDDESSDEANNDSSSNNK